MAIYREKRKDRFTIIDNVPLQDPNISNKALGLLVRMLAFPDDWKFYEADLVKRCNKDGREAIHNQMLELQRLGYVTKIHHRDKNGKFAKTDLVVHEQPVSPSTGNPSTDNPSTVKPSTGNPSTDNPSTVKPSTGNQHLLNTNKPNTNITNNSNNSLSNEAGNIPDPFSDPPMSKGERENQVNNLIYRFAREGKFSISLAEIQQVKNATRSVLIDDIESCINQALYAISTGTIQSPVGYLITLLKNSKGANDG